MPRLLISDANILIDLEHGGLSRHAFQAGFEIAALDSMYEEELRAHHPNLKALGLRLLPLAPEGIAAALDLVARHQGSGTGTNDLLSLALAIQERCPLLSGDAKLRRVAEKEGHVVRGTLWLMQTMFDAGAVNLAKVEAAYARMKANGRRLPWDEVERQISQMRSV